MANLELMTHLESGARKGPGKAALLESARDTGSISAASRALGMDYRRAWLLLATQDRAFDTPVVQRNAGGHGGGGATLTAFGLELLDRYRRQEAAVASLDQADLAEPQRRALRSEGPKA